VNARHPWARIREDRAASPGRHSPDYLEKRPMPASPAAPLPLLSERPDARLGALYPVPGEPKVQCKLCGLVSPASEMSQIPELGWGPRCYDADECTTRQMDKLYPNPLPAAGFPLPTASRLAAALEPLPERVPAVVPEAVPVLPPAQEAALERFTEASDEQDAAEAGQDRTEDEELPEAVAEPPVSDGDGAEPDAAPAVAEGSEPEDGGEGK
jgi:hypothetical protein